MINLVRHKTDFGLEAAWTFSATSHGKVAGDGFGAFLKSITKRAVLSKGVYLSSPRDFYDFLVENQNETAKATGKNNPTVYILFLPAAEVEIANQRTINRRMQQLDSTGNEHVFQMLNVLSLSNCLRKIKGIRDMHQFQPSADMTITYLPTSMSHHSSSFSFR